MKTEQKIVAVGAGSGVLVMAGMIALLYHLLPTVELTSVVDRIALALKSDVIALVPLFAMLATVGNERFLFAASLPIPFVVVIPIA